MKRFILFLLLFLCVNFASSSTKEIIPIVGVIDDEMIEDVVDRMKNVSSENVVFYLDTPGGSVSSGMKLLPYLQNSNSICVVQSAYSMGFILLQACKKRYILPYGSLMQHDMHLGVRDDFHRLRSYLQYLERVYEKLLKLQIDRIGISKELFVQKILQNWWMTAEEAVQENCADAIIHSLDSLTI